MARKTSGRHAGGSHLTVEFSSDESGPEDLRLTLACGWLHIAHQKGVKEVVSQEGHEQKAFDGAGVMLEHMIGVPFVGQLVEAIIFDIPSLVPQMDDAMEGNLGRRQGGRPDPVTRLWMVLLVELPAYRVGLQGTNHAHGSVHLGPGE